MNGRDRHALVFGATGFLGRHLILALDQAGIRVTAATRDSTSPVRLSTWLAEHGCRVPPVDVRVDFDAPELLTGDPLTWADVTEIYNCAGAYRFGMTMSEARHANVASARAIVAFAAGLPRLQRLVHVSGYRVGGQDPATVPWSDELVRRTYQRLGPYEASKVEADAVVAATADQLGVPWTIVNPSSVIGVSTTGESDQQIGLATTVKDIWHGSLAAIPGNARTFVPVICVDYLARFMTLLPEDLATTRAAFWVLDDTTPPLPELIALVARHFQVRAPRLRVPVSLVRRLPTALTRADPETLTFLSADRYPTGPARAFAVRHGLTPPDTTESILCWADHLAAHRFGAVPTQRPERAFTWHAGVRTFGIGTPGASTLVLPGLPINADTWATVTAMIGQARVVDLPGLGLSAGRPRDWSAWLAALVAEADTTHLVGHSIGAAAALEAGLANPDQVPQLTLVSPSFLQQRPRLLSRVTPLTSAYLRRVRPDVLSRLLTGDTAHAAALASSVEDLRRGSVATQVARLLATASRERYRSDLCGKLQRYPGRVHVIVGAQDPLTDAGQAVLAALGPRAQLTTIPGAGHHPQLTHSDEVAQAISAVRPARQR